MVEKEWQLIELLEPETRARVKRIVEWSEILLDESPYRLSLPDYISGFPTLRTAEQQYSLYLKGRPELEGGKRGGKVTYTDGYKKKSYHQSGKAIDIGLRFRKGSESFIYYDQAGRTAKEIFNLVIMRFKAEGFEWGGDWTWKDWNHFQRK